MNGNKKEPQEEARKHNDDDKFLADGVELIKQLLEGTGNPEEFETKVKIFIAEGIAWKLEELAKLIRVCCEAEKEKMNSST